MPEVRKNAAQGRYEIVDGETVMGYAEFSERGQTVVMPHTVVEPQYEGQGIGGKLAEFALKDIQASGQKVQPDCSFIAGYISKHPEYAELVKRD